MFGTRNLTAHGLQLATILLLLLLPASMLAADGASHWNTNADGVALDGFDVVAYHTQDRAMRGNAENAVTHDGAKFYFANAENKAAFAKQPARYLPSFGGYCAFGVAKQKAKVPTDPRTFKLYNGELLLFYNDLYQGQPVNTKVMWNQHEQALYDQAAATWKTLK